LPVIASKPRVSPGVFGSCGVSSVLAPRASTLRNTTGTPLQPTLPRSVMPFCPNPADGLPVSASSATRELLDWPRVVKTMRGPTPRVPASS
jgi:hypothetical protein